MPKSKEDYIIAAMQGVLSNQNARLIGDKEKIAEFAIEFGTVVYDKVHSKDKPKKKTTPPELDIPDIEEFWEHARANFVKLKKDPSVYEFAVRAKFAAWVANKWRDGFQKEIKNWKLKLDNVLPSLKPVYPKDYDHNKTEPKRQEKKRLN